MSSASLTNGELTIDMTRSLQRSIAERNSGDVCVKGKAIVHVLDSELVPA
jgi:hypothetical protein